MTRSVGGILGALQQERHDAQAKAVRDAHERWERTLAWAHRNFTDRQAPHAAAAVITRGPAKPSVVRRHLEAEKPYLFTTEEPIVICQREKGTL